MECRKCRRHIAGITADPPFELGVEGDGLCLDESGMEIGEAGQEAATALFGLLSTVIMPRPIAPEREGSGSIKCSWSAC